MQDGGYVVGQHRLAELSFQPGDDGQPQPTAALDVNTAGIGKLFQSTAAQLVSHRAAANSRLEGKTGKSKNYF